jgi:hypothetical protein
MYAQLAAVSLLAFFAQSAVAADCARSYTINDGDWCDTISAAKNVSTYQLAVVNPDINQACTNLMPGKSLCLGHVGEDCATTYVVKANDRCSQIIANHGLNSTIFEHNNPQINDACDNIYIGEVLCVSKSVQVPPLPSGTLPAATIPPGATPAVPQSSSSVAPAATTAALVATSAPVAVTTPAPVASTTPAAAPAPTPASEDDEDCEDEGEDDGSDEADDGECEEDGEGEGDDEDDEDLPFCDEI